MTQLYQLFDSDSISGFSGKYCRVGLDDKGNAEYIQDLIFDDEYGVIKSNPIV